MGDISAAIVVLAGTILVATAVVNSQLTDASRQRLVGMGLILMGLGLVVWLATVGARVYVLGVGAG